jgi:hypothetical protein
VNGSLTVPVSGTTMTPPAIGVAPASLAFGDVSVGASATASVTVTNGGDQTLVVSGVSACSGTTAEYAFPATGFSLAKGAARTISVTYTPSAPGTDAGCLSVASNDPAAPVKTVSLTGTGHVPSAEILVTPASLSFGAVKVGSAATLTAQVTNVGDLDLFVDSIALRAGTSPEFFVAPVSVVLLPGQSQTVVVNYVPSGAGVDTGFLDLVSNDPLNPVVSVSLAATGVQPPVISASPSPLAFGNVARYNTKTLTLSVSNGGGGTLNVSGVARCAGTSSEFSVPGTGFSVAPGATKALSVSYRPTGRGTDTGCIAITSDDAVRNPLQVPVSGTGT